MMIVLFLINFLPHEAYYGLNIGARPLALGYAVSSHRDDPTCVFFNPAGLAAVEQGSFSLHYALDDFDFTESGTIKAISFILPDLSLTYHLIANYQGISRAGPQGQSGFRDERYRIEEYFISVSSRTANPSFENKDPFTLGFNVKYLRGQYIQVEEDSAGFLVSYLNSEGAGYGFDAGGLLRVNYLVVGLLLRDVYSKLKWYEVPQAEIDRIKFIPRIGISYKTERILLSFDIEKVEKISYHLGGEVSIGTKGFALKPRGGLVFGESGIDYYTLGGGITIKEFLLDLGIDLKTKRTACSLSFQI